MTPNSINIAGARRRPGSLQLLSLAPGVGSLALLAILYVAGPQMAHAAAGGVEARDDNAPAINQGETLSGYDPLQNDRLKKNKNAKISSISSSDGEVTLEDALGPTAAISFTPAADFSGTARIDYTLCRTDKCGSNNAESAATITVQVNGANEAPTANDDALVTDEDAAVSADPRVNDSDPNGDDLTIVGTTDGSKGRVTFRPGEVTYSPDRDANGSDSFTYTVSDGAAQSTATVSVTINPVNDPPVARDDTVTTTEGSAITVDALVNDTDVDAGDTLTLVSATEATKGSIQLTDTDVTYTPNAGETGNDTFTYTVSDGDAEDSAVIEVRIETAQNDPPTARADTATGEANSTIAIDVLGNDFDPEDDAISIARAAVQAPANGSVQAVGGQIEYTPDADYVGDDVFTYEVTDGALFDRAEVSITVTPEGGDEPPPPEEVQTPFELSDVPLELAVGVIPNVLIVMDDSGSMDWTLLTAEPGGVMRLDGKDFSYLYTLPTNVFGRFQSNGQVMPSAAAIAADDNFAGNDFGVWRARYSGFNRLYYNPAVRYEPWRGLDRNGNELADVPPDAAPLDPYNPSQTIDLTQRINYEAEDVPTTTGEGGDLVGGERDCTERTFDRDRGNDRDLCVQNYLIPRYYTSEVSTVPGPDAPHKLVEILPPDDPAADYTNYPGGSDRSDCEAATGNPNTCPYALEIRNFANWFTYYRSREYTVKSSLGRVVAGSSAVKVGYSTLNNPNDRIRIREMNPSFRLGNKGALLDQIYKIDSNGGTPLRDALDAAGRHFACTSGDAFGSSSDSSPGDAACPVESAPEGQCQQNFSLLFTDGFWNGGTPGGVGDRDDDDSSDFDEGIFDGDVSNTLADVAMKYYEQDLHDELDDLVPTSGRDRALAPTGAFTDGGSRTFQHMTTFTVGFGVSGALTESDIPDDITADVDWGDPFSEELAKIDDLRHAALNGRGDYLSAADSVELDADLTAAFEEFGSGTGAASAVAFNSQQVRQQSVVYRGFYNTVNNTGDLIAQEFDAATNRLVEPPTWSAAGGLESDSPGARVIVTWNDDQSAGRAFRMQGLTADQRSRFNQPTINYLRGDRSNEEPGGPFRARPIVRGRLGDIVDSTPVFVGAPNALDRDRPSFPLAANDLYTGFQDAQSSRRELIYVGANDGMLHSFDADTGEELFAYVPSPVISGAPNGNDIADLADPAYNHQFYVDGTPAINDVFIDSSGGTNRSWHTVLVGSLRAGGKGYFALDITDPSAFVSDSGAADQVLWEFTVEDDTYPVDANGDPIVDANDARLTDPQGNLIKDLGYAFAEPTVAMTRVAGAGAASLDGGGTSSEKKWAAVFGNGINATHGVAKLFVLFLEDGADGSWDNGDFVKLNTGVGVPASGDPDAGRPNGLGTPRLVDLDDDGTVDYAYAGDLLGNLYRFDLTAADPASWDVTRIFRASYADGTRQPITSQPVVMRHPDKDGVIVVVGTGKFIASGDGSNTDIQSLYGVWDRVSVVNGTFSTAAPPAPDGDRGLLFEQELANLADGSGNSVRTVSDGQFEYASEGACDEGADSPQCRGWVVDLDAPASAGGAAAEFPGERAIRNLQLRGGFVFVNTVIPPGDSACELGPGGFALALNPLTGGRGGLNADTAFDLDNDGNFDADDKVNSVAVSGLRFEDGVPTDSSFLGTKRFTQLSDRSIDIRETNTAFGKRAGRLSWRELN